MPDKFSMNAEQLVFEYLKNKATSNIYISKMIADEYCKSNNIAYPNLNMYFSNDQFDLLDI